MRGLFAHFELVSEFLYGNPSTHISSLSETHTQPSENIDVFDIPGYTYIDRPRKSGSGGGVGVYINEKLDFIRRNDLESDQIESIWIEIRIKNSKNMLLCILYKPPDS